MGTISFHGMSFKARGFGEAKGDGHLETTPRGKEGTVGSWFQAEQEGPEKGQEGVLLLMAHRSSAGPIKGPWKQRKEGG